MFFYPRWHKWQLSAKMALLPAAARRSLALVNVHAQAAARLVLARPVHDAVGTHVEAVVGVAGAQIFEAQLAALAVRAGLVHAFDLLPADFRHADERFRLRVVRVVGAPYMAARELVKHLCLS